MAACVQSSCNATSDIRLSSALKGQLCGPSYKANGTLANAVGSAVTAATTQAAYFTQGEDPSEPLNYPPCAVSVISDRVMRAEWVADEGDSKTAITRTCMVAAVACLTRLASAKVRLSTSLLDPVIPLSVTRKTCKVS